MALVEAELDLQADPITGPSVTPFGGAVVQPTLVSGTQHTCTHLAAGTGSAVTTKTPPRHTLLNLAGASKPASSSPPLSPATTPTTYSFGPLSPHSFNSSVQGPSTTVASFTHSRDSSLDAGSTISARARRDMVRMAKSRTHNRSVSSLDLCLRFRHQPAGSRDWDDPTQNMSRLLAVQSPPQEFEPLEECIDEDLLKYRQEDQPIAKPLIDAVFIKDPTAEEQPQDAPSPCYDSPADIQEDTALPSSDNKDEQDTGSTDDEKSDRAVRAANAILDEAFDLQLGSAAPPEDVVELVRQCLSEISLSLQRARGMGALATVPGTLVCHAAGPASSTAGPGSFEPSPSRDKSPGTGRKRFAQDDEGQEDDTQEEDGRGGDIAGLSDAGHRKKAKLEQYPCPFRKRSPHRFNCREWEYCAKAPFKSMTELKKHILKYHQQQHFMYKCIRCHSGFTKVDDLEKHLRVDIASMCSVQPGPSPSLADEERITAAVGNQLRSRANHYDWMALWKTLFPKDVLVPEPEFEPIIELHEVDHEFQSSLAAFQLQLHSTLDALLSGWTPPRGRNNATQLRHVVDGTLENLFRDFVATTFRNTRDKVAVIASELPRSQEVVYDNNNNINTRGPVSAPASSLVTPRAGAPAATPIRPKPRAILAHPLSTSQQRLGNNNRNSSSSSSGWFPVSSSSPRYSFVSSTGSGSGSSSRLRDSITAESVASMSTSGESYYYSPATKTSHRHLPFHPLPASTPTTIASSSHPHSSRPQQQLEFSQMTTAAARQSVLADTEQPQKPPKAAEASLFLFVDQFSNSGNNSQRDSGIIPDMMFDDDGGQEDCTRCFSNFLNLGPCQCQLDDGSNPAVLEEEGGIWG